MLNESQAQLLFELIDANRQHLRRWLPWVDKQVSSEESKLFIRRSLQQIAENNGFQCAIWHKKRLAGVIGYHAINWPNRRTSIGYWLGQEFIGKGIMTMACRALTHYALVDMKLNRVEIACAVENRKSCAIPERLGYTLEGTLREGEWLYDHFVDHHLYGMLASDWKRLNS